MPLLSRSTVFSTYSGVDPLCIGRMTRRFSHTFLPGEASEHYLSRSSKNDGRRLSGRFLHAGTTCYGSRVRLAFRRRRRP